MDKSVNKLRTAVMVVFAVVFAGFILWVTSSWVLAVLALILTAGLMLFLEIRRMASPSDDEESDQPARQPKNRPTSPEPVAGLSGLFWNQLGGRWLYSAFQFEFLAYRTLSDRDAYVKDELWKLRHRRKFYAVRNNKGGVGKTPVTGNLAAAEESTNKGAPVVAIDNNFAAGNLAKQLGMQPPDTLLVRQYLSIFPDIEDAEQLYKQLDRPRKNGVWLIANNTNSMSTVPLRQLIEGSRKLKRIAGGSVFSDTGNGGMDSPNLAAVYVADTTIVVGNASTKGNRGDLDFVGQTIGTYRDVGLNDEMDAAVIFILGARCTAANRNRYAKLFDWPINQIAIIPKSRRMQKRGEIDISKLPQRVRVPLFEALLTAKAAKSVVSTKDIEELQAEVDREAAAYIAKHAAGIRVHEHPAVQSAVKPSPRRKVSTVKTVSSADAPAPADGVSSARKPAARKRTTGTTKATTTDAPATADGTTNGHAAGVDGTNLTSHKPVGVSEGDRS